MSSVDVRRTSKLQVIYSPSRAVVDIFLTSNSFQTSFLYIGSVVPCFQRVEDMISRTCPCPVTKRVMTAVIHKTVTELGKMITLMMCSRFLLFNGSLFSFSLSNNNPVQGEFVGFAVKTMLNLERVNMLTCFKSTNTLLIK